MRCPSCQHEDSRVVDSRTAGDAIRRRRACSACGFRFTTHERVEELRMPWVVKKDGRREPWNRDKVLHGLNLACRKRPVDRAGIEAAASAVEQRLLTENEVSTAQVGEALMAVLRDLDPVAYVRFASVYGAFESVEQFSEVISSFGREPADEAPSSAEATDDW